MCPVLSEEFHTSLLSHGEQGEIDLMDFVRNAMFEAVVKQLFGHDNVPQEKVCSIGNSYVPNDVFSEFVPFYTCTFVSFEPVVY